MITLDEGKFGNSPAAIHYTRVSSCLTVTCFCSNGMYGIHGVMNTENTQLPSIQELLSTLKNSIKDQELKKLIIACDTTESGWGWNGKRLREHVWNISNFSHLAVYLGFPVDTDTQSIDIYTPQVGNCELVNVGPGSIYINSHNSAYFIVLSSGLILSAIY